MKKTLSTIIAVLAIHLCLGQNAAEYSRVKIYLDDAAHSKMQLARLGVPVDHGEYKRNTFFTSDFSAQEIAQIRAAGFKTEILIPDVKNYYREQNAIHKSGSKKTDATCNTLLVDDPAHFHLGSYGGYFTYDEMLQILDSMNTLYPAFITTRQEIDTFHSIQGRSLYWLRMSNDPGTDHPERPQILYTSLTHAREPGSLSTVIYFMWYMLEHHDDPQVKAILDNCELYFVPCVNPDGYLNNLSTDPGGGGMWRKNMRDNLDGTYGADINRNYGYNWGVDDYGSSPMTASEVYRGTAGFSEPETRAIKWFCEQHHFAINLNYHTFNNDILYPWDYSYIGLTSDSSQYFAYGSLLTKDNHYRYGTCYQTLDYVANGCSDDWMYADISTKNKIFGMTPEVGYIEYGFYPPASEIYPDCEKNLTANINAASLLLPYATIHATDEKIITQSAGHLHYRLQALGIPDSQTFTVSIIPLDSWLSTPASPITYSYLAPMQQVVDSFAYTISAATPNGQLIRYVISLSNSYYTVTDTEQFYYGRFYTHLTPSTSSLAGWVNNGWGLCNSIYYTPPSSIGSDSLGCGNYFDNSDVTIQLKDTIDLTHSLHAYLQFFAQWGIESSYDYAEVQASVDGSDIWTPLCGKYTKAGTSYQDYDNPLYDGQQPTWVQEQIDLGAYIGQKINLRYQLVSDAAVNYEGFYFDDISILSVDDSTTGLHQAVVAPSGYFIYPNPANNNFTISLRNIQLSDNVNGAMYDCFGRDMRTIVISNTNTTVDVKSLPAGVYYVKLFDNGKPLPVQKIEVVR